MQDTLDGFPSKLLPVSSHRLLSCEAVRRSASPVIARSLCLGSLSGHGGADSSLLRPGIALDRRFHRSMAGAGAEAMVGWTGGASADLGHAGRAGHDSYALQRRYSGAVYLITTTYMLYMHTHSPRSDTKDSYQRAAISVEHNPSVDPYELITSCLDYSQWHCQVSNKPGNHNHMRPSTLWEGIEKGWVVLPALQSIRAI
jgi:hypothetical protein